MSSRPQISPCHSHNSIEMVGLSITFSGNEGVLGQEFESKLSNNKYFSALFDSIEYVTSNALSNKPAIHLAKKSAEFEWEWLVRLTSDGIYIFNRDYSRWKYFWEFCLTLLMKFEEQFSGSKIDSILLGYLDVFCVHDLGKFNYSQIYKKSDLIPSVVFNNKFANTKVGYPVELKKINDSAWVDVALSTEYKEDEDKFKLLCDTSARVYFDKMLYCDFLKEEGRLVFEYYDGLHVLLKDVFQEIIMDDVLKKVGIKGE